MSIFRAYDIRGVYKKDLTDEIVEKIAKTFVNLLKAKKVVVGIDVRTSSPELKESVIRGLISQGCEIIDIGLVPIPLFYYFIVKYKYNAGIYVTGSHDPLGYNGLKLCKSKAIDLTNESGIAKIEKIYNKKYLEVGRGKIIKKRLKKYPELKGNNSSNKVRYEVLQRFIKTKSEIFVIILEKSKVYEYLKEKKNKLYNYISNLILNECSFDNPSICLIVDKSKSNRSLREDFDNYIRQKLDRRNQLCKLTIRHENSQNEACLQILDFISWAIFRNYEYKDSQFLDIIKDKIVIRKEVFQKEISGP